ncbi:hypothetical protein ACTBAC_000465 [Vibrio parahaemolyticus]|nr:hypothetical protein [Vibrio parahaemolyticus]KIT48591.1 hypothetical protein H334_09755 [Vibrio parahaemolyticus 901128]EIE1256866.1 hypothetical protein [Vibrio parahaemolyticus]EIE1334768.1 hypothetical protein [Vibrio parahaemolyticus]EJC6879781.1 hypothetical protein [Vibrio parahaemolyticus]
MKYSIEYQLMAEGASRPSDDGDVVGIEASDESGLVILPNVGDYVDVNNHSDGEGRASICGVVKTKLFRYIRIPNGEMFCHVNIVVQEDKDIDWGSLIKE